MNHAGSAVVDRLGVKGGDLIMGLSKAAAGAIMAWQGRFPS